jgi:hypothetical protein
MSYNPIMVWLIYSPFHRMLSGVMMVLNYSGRKSGKAYRLPVGYKRVDGILLTISYKQRTWWRNLRGGVPVIIRLQGKDVIGRSEVIEDEVGVMEGLKAFIGTDAKAGRMFGVKLSPNGLPDYDSLQQAAQGRVIVRTTLV